MILGRQARVLSKESGIKTFSLPSFPRGSSYCSPATLSTTNTCLWVTQSLQSSQQDHTRVGSTQGREAPLESSSISMLSVAPLNTTPFIQRQTKDVNFAFLTLIESLLSKPSNSYELSSNAKTYCTHGQLLPIYSYTNSMLNHEQHIYLPGISYPNPAQHKGGKYMVITDVFLNK